MALFKKEAELLSAVHDVAASISEQSLDPTAAAIKVARDRQLTPPMIDLLCRAHNVGRAAVAREQGSGTLDKLAAFPLADPAQVREAVYPASPLTPVQKQASVAVSPEYSRPAVPLPVTADAQGHTKAAGTPDWLESLNGTGLRQVQMANKAGTTLYELGAPASMETGLTFDKAMGVRERCKRAVEEARRRLDLAKHGFLAGMGGIRTYFKQPATARLPLHEVEANARLLFGAPVKPLFDYVAATTEHRGLRDTGIVKQASVARASDTPYKEVAAAIKAGETLIDAQKTYSATVNAAEEKVSEACRPFVETPPNSPLGQQLGFPMTKQAAGGFWGGVGVGTLSSNLANGLFKSAPMGDLVAGARDDIMSPDHTDTLRKIQARSVLNDLMSNDEIISGYEPEEITDAYNEIAAMSPNVALQSAAVRPLLRKRLAQGAMEVFDAQQMADIEQKINRPIQDDKVAGVLDDRTSILG